MCMARDFFKTLSSKNIFKPKVLAMVSRNGKWSVGSSIAVSHFLRPQCLYKRIAKFKPSLQNAIISYKPLDTGGHETSWSSAAFSTGVEGGTKAPCQNCTTIFKNLEGFVQEKSNTFLGACAEYCPVNQLLQEDSVEALSEDDRQWINAALGRNRKQCKVLFEEFSKIESKCNKARGTKGERDVFCEIRDKVHIFGLKPECNKYFGGSNVVRRHSLWIVWFLFQNFVSLK